MFLMNTWIFVVVLFVLWAISIYNGLVGLRKRERFEAVIAACGSSLQKPL